MISFISCAPTRAEMMSAMGCKLLFSYKRLRDCLDLRFATACS